MFWPGLLSILLGILVLAKPMILVTLAASLMIGIGSTMLVAGWRARRAWRCFDAGFWRQFSDAPW